jgi:hypothetical protein
LEQQIEDGIWKFEGWLAASADETGFSLPRKQLMQLVDLILLRRGEGDGIESGERHREFLQTMQWYVSFIDETNETSETIY